MIPKIVHYCWFGENELPELAKKCIESWKKFLPDYEIKEWNESNFDIDRYRYTREAYDSKKFAYVTDVVRLYALKNEGGIYLDTDVEILKPLDEFLRHFAFSGFENNNSVPTGIMGSRINGNWANDMLKYYDNVSFIDKFGQPNLETNVVIITDLMKEKGIIMDNSFQEIPEYVTFYPHDFFCPKDHSTGIINLTNNSHCIHHFAGSWLPSSYHRKRKIINFFKKLIGINRYNKIRGYE